MGDIGNVCKMSVDGTDFRIREPKPFSPKWYSEKFNGPSLRYEVGICLITGWIVWINGPFPCGEWPDIRISRDSLIYMLRPNEKVLSDLGYPGQYHLQPEPGRRGTRLERRKALGRSRHENINGYFKEFGCLQQRWRHQIGLHDKVFWSVANLTQLKIRFEDRHWQVQYNDQVDN